MDIKKATLTIKLEKATVAIQVLFRDSQKQASRQDAAASSKGSSDKKS